MPPIEPRGSDTIPPTPAVESFDHVAFLPDPLPKSLTLAPETYLAVTRATAAVARLDQAALRLPNPSLLARPAIRQEAVSTSALEGTFAALDDVLEADFLNRDQLSASVSEVVNYVEAAETAFEWVHDKPITVGLLEHLQGILVRGTRGDTSDAGGVRTPQVFIGTDGGRVADARFVPPPPGDQLKAGIEGLGRVDRHRGQLPRSDQDGFGSLSVRDIASLQRRQRSSRPARVRPATRAGRGASLPDSQPVAVAGTPPPRQDHLLRCSATGEFDGWIRFFCEAAREQATREMARIEALHDWRDRTLGVIRDSDAGGRLITAIAEDLIGYPLVTPKAAAARYQAAGSSPRPRCCGSSSLTDDYRRSAEVVPGVRAAASQQ